MDWSIKGLLDALTMHGECCHIEAKECRECLGKSARETISAFSNEPDLNGGYLVLGLKRSDSHYIPVGVKDPDKLQCELANACREEFNVLIRPEIRVGTIHGKTLVVAFISETFVRDKPIFIKKFGVEKGAFRRIGSADHRCTAHDLDLLYQLRSGIPYENEILPDVSWEDIDPDAIVAYRRQRLDVDSGASELKLSDKDLLVSLRCLIQRRGKVLPNVAGLLLFGSKAALRRLLPSDARVDYVITEGSRWIGDPSTRYYSTDYREPLITLLPRLHAQIMGDLPKKFTLETGKLQRTDTPSIPRNVIREALANALMHRDYRAGQPTLVIRYSNRLEFKNAGYSLKPFEELGKPGSKQRNRIIAGVFHELNYAETKGTGIGSMKEWMQKAGLTTPPIIETDRDRNEFDLVLLPHHLLDRRALEWLSQFKDIALSDAQRRALVFTRELGAITNQDYRQLNGTDTLTASAALRRLRDTQLLTQKGKGNGTYYILDSTVLEVVQESIRNAATPHISALSGGLTPHITPLSGGLTPHITHECKGLEAVSEGVPPLADEVREQIASLRQRSPKNEVQRLIKALCVWRPLQLAQLAQILDRDPKYLREYYLTKMIKSGVLIYQYPDTPAHPQQAYKIPIEGKE